MITVRQANERGHFDHGWLDTYHTFSFDRYYDSRHMGFRDLRVINEDRVAPGHGFPTHPHRDMEIITYVVEGALAHKDSMGTGSTIRPHEVQRMSAGTGVRHSEANPSEAEPVHLLQIWILPERGGLQPSYEQRKFPPEEKQNQLRLIASGQSGDGAVQIHQDVNLYASLLDAGQSVHHDFAPGRHGWVQVVRGEITANGTKLTSGDGAALSGEKQVEIKATSDAEFLLFDLR